MGTDRKETILAFAIPEFLPYDDGDGTRGASLRARACERFGLGDGVLDPSYETQYLGKRYDGTGHVYTVKGPEEALRPLRDSAGVVLLDPSEPLNQDQLFRDILGLNVLRFDMQVSPAGLGWNPKSGDEAKAIRKIATEHLGVRREWMAAQGRAARLPALSPVYCAGERVGYAHAYEIEMVSPSAVREAEQEIVGRRVRRQWERKVESSSVIARQKRPAPRVSLPSRSSQNNSGCAGSALPDGGGARDGSFYTNVQVYIPSLPPASAEGVAVVDRARKYMLATFKGEGLLPTDFDPLFGGQVSRFSAGPYLAEFRIRREAVPKTLRNGAKPALPGDMSRPSALRRGTPAKAAVSTRLSAAAPSSGTSPAAPSLPSQPLRYRRVSIYVPDPEGSLKGEEARRAFVRDSLLRVFKDAGLKPVHLDPGDKGYFQKMSDGTCLVEARVKSEVAEQIAARRNNYPSLERISR